MPDVLLTVFYCLDPKTGYLIKKFTRFVFQPDGPSDGELNLPHSSLSTDFAFHNCNFEVSMDILFGAGVVDKRGVSIGANLGVEKPGGGPKGGGDITLEGSKEAPGTITRLHAHIVGSLNVREKRLDVVGEIVGIAKTNISY